MVRAKLPAGMKRVQVSLTLSAQVVDAVDRMVKSGKFATRSDAIDRLLKDALIRRAADVIDGRPPVSTAPRGNR